MIWDGMRAIDYLVSRPDVDPSRLGVTGRSGGGTQSAYLGAMDTRIKAAAPENYITTFRRLIETRGVQDAEQNFTSGIASAIDLPDLLALISGNDRGTRGRVLEVDVRKRKVLVEGVNRVKRHTRPNPQRNIKGGILEKENYVDVSNVALIDPETDRPTRVGVQEGKGGTKVRVAKRSGKLLDR